MALLREYARHNSEKAFSTLVSSHVNLVYSVALQEVHDPHLAEEITQAVFIILARKANLLGGKTILSGWLCRTARYASANALTIQRRRQQREKEACMQSVLNESEPGVWTQIAPLLGGAMKQLGQKDHDAVVLRFFEGKSFQEIGAAFGASENAAKKRVAYALEKLRKYFSKHGVTSTTSAIAGSISANSVQAAPALLAKSVTAVAIAKGAAASGSTLTLIKGALKLMAWTKTKTIIAGAVTALLVGGVVAPETIHVVRTAFYPNIAGTWEGIMPLGGMGINTGQTIDTRIVLKLSKVWGHYVADLDEIDVGRSNVPVAKVVYNFPDIQLIVIPRRNMVYKGKVNARARDMNLSGMILRRTLTPPPPYAPLADSDFAPQAGSALQGYWKGGIILSSGRYPDGLGGQQLANWNNWHGEPMNASNTLPLDLKIAEADDGTFRAELDSPMQGADGQPASLTYSHGAVELALNSNAGKFQGMLDSAGREISGAWIQGGNSLPAFLQRADYQAEVAQMETENFSFTSASELQGHWKGAWHLIAGTNNITIPLALDIGKLPDGTYLATLANLEQLGNDSPIPASSFEYSPPDLHMEWQWAGGAYDGRLENGKIVGTWSEGGGRFTLVFERQK